MYCAKLDKITPVWVALDAKVPQKYLLTILDFAPEICYKHPGDGVMWLVVVINKQQHG